MSDLSSGACEVIAAIEKCQTDRARLQSLLAEGVNSAVDAGPQGDAQAVLPWTFWPRSARPSPHAPTTSPL